MTKSPLLLFVLIASTVIQTLTILVSFFGSLLLTFGFSLMFRDSPTATQAFPWWMALMIMGLTMILPIAIIIGQWVFYRLAWYRTALGIAIAGLLPLLGPIARILHVN